MKLVGVTILFALPGRFLSSEAQSTPAAVVDATDACNEELSGQGLENRLVGVSKLFHLSFQLSLEFASDCPEFLLALNLARTARMDNQPGLLRASTMLQAQAQEVLKAKFTDKDNCSDSAEHLSPAKMGGYYQNDPYYSPQKGEEEARKAVQDDLDHGVSELKANPASGAVFDPSKPPFSNEFVQNTAYFMFPDSTEVGCARTTDCDDGGPYILCLFSPTLVIGKSVPFPSGVYQSLLARGQYQIKLMTLTKNDVQTRLTPFAGGGQEAAGGEAAGAGAASESRPSSSSLPATTAQATTTIAATTGAAAGCHVAQQIKKSFSRCTCEAESRGGVRGFFAAGAGAYEAPLIAHLICQSSTPSEATMAAAGCRGRLLLFS
ncbi:hypothetical protein ACSSS7_005249 [Eimeria intestinalis]